MISSTEHATLVIFCRRPAPGVGKQRIAAELGRQAGLEVGELLLAVALEDAREWEGLVVLAPARETDAAWAHTLLQGAYVIPQPDGNLGQRISAVHERAQQIGNHRVLTIGTDAPALTPDDLAMAAQSLATHDTVIIPARDGGVTLLGTRLQWPLLDALPWETPQLGEALVDLCRAAGHNVYVMATGSDVDTRKDLVDAYAQLASDFRPARLALRNWIERAGLVPTLPSANSDISVIVPVLDDLVALQQLLGRLATLHPPVAEVIVVDASADNCCESLCATHRAVYLRAEPNRGKQLKQGAGAATKSILWFLHADSTPDPKSVEVIREHLHAGHTSGYFRFRFDGPRRWYKSVLEHAINFRARTGIPYGDQGLFVMRDAYVAAGGHAETPLFEEVPLVRNLRASQGCRAVPAALTISSRRWERDGWLRRSLHNRRLAIAFAMGVAPETLARNYGFKSRSNNRTDNLNA